MGKNPLNPFGIPSAALTPYDAPQTLIHLRGDTTQRGQIMPVNGLLTPQNAPLPDDINVNVTWVASPHNYAFVNSQQFDIGTTSQKLIEQPVNFRNFLAFRNASSGVQIAYIDFGQDASVANSIFRIQPGQMILFDAVVPQNDIYCVFDAAGGSIIVAYGNIALET